MPRPRHPNARLALAATAAVAGVACWGGGGEATLAGLPTGMECALGWGEPERVGSIPGELKEVSGFVSSAAHADVAWMVRDSGNPAVVYSFEVDDDGKVTFR